MKKLLMFTLAAAALTAPAAYAESGSDSGKDGRHHKGKMFEKMDLNGDGAITQEEFNKAHEERFKKLDVDGDGKITKGEIDTAKAKWREMRQQRQEQREDDMHKSDSHE